MSKAILEIDMPESCYCCVLSDFSGYAPFCRIEQKSYFERMDERPYWCPLREKIIRRN